MPSLRPWQARQGERVSFQGKLCMSHTWLIFLLVEIMFSGMSCALVPSISGCLEADASPWYWFRAASDSAVAVRGLATSPGAAVIPGADGRRFFPFTASLCFTLCRNFDKAVCFAFQSFQSSFWIKPLPPPLCTTDDEIGVLISTI